jgi:hypothetical protein
MGCPKTEHCPEIWGHQQLQYGRAALLPRCIAACMTIMGSQADDVMQELAGVCCNPYYVIFACQGWAHGVWVVSEQCTNPDLGASTVAVGWCSPMWLMYGCALDDHGATGG